MHLQGFLRVGLREYQCPFLQTLWHHPSRITPFSQRYLSNLFFPLLPTWVVTSFIQSRVTDNRLWLGVGCWGHRYLRHVSVLKTWAQLTLMKSKWMYENMLGFCFQQYGRWDILLLRNISKHWICVSLCMSWQGSQGNAMRCSALLSTDSIHFPGVTSTSECPRTFILKGESRRQSLDHSGQDRMSDQRL